MLTSGYGGDDFSYSKRPGLGLGAGASMDFTGDSAPVITYDGSQMLPAPPDVLKYGTVPDTQSPGVLTALRSVIFPTQAGPPSPTTKEVVNQFTDWINANKTYVYALLAVLGVVGFLKRK